MGKYTKVLWIRDMEADIVNIKINIFDEIDYGSVLRAVGCAESQMCTTKLPYGLIAYHDKDGLCRDGAHLTTIKFHAMQEDYTFGGNVIVMGGGSKRIGLSEYQEEVIKDKKKFTAGFSGRVSNGS